jgi:hypothetical protein
MHVGTLHVGKSYMAQSLTVCAPKCMPSPQIGLMMKTLNRIVKRAMIAMLHVKFLD